MTFGRVALRRMVVDACDGPFGSALKTEHYTEDGARVVRLGNIGSGAWLDSDAVFIDPNYWATLAPHHAVAGDLIIAGLGDEGHPVGRACVLPDVGPALVKADCYRLRLDPEKTDARFMARYLSSAVGSGEAARLADGSTRSRLTLAKALAIQVPDCTLHLQCAIADYLDAETARIDALVRAREATIPLLWERYWAAVDAAMRDLDRPEPLSRHCLSMTDGPFGSSLTSAHYALDEDGARVIRLGNIGRAVFEDEDRAFILWRHFALLTKHGAVADDLVVAGLGDESNPLGRACVVPEDLGPTIVKADCFRFRLNQQRLLPAYAALFLSSATGGKLMQELARGSTRQRANLGAVASVRVPAPPIERQREAVDMFNVRRAVTARAAGAMQSQVDLLLERRQALITAAVTGQLEIPGVAA